MRTLPSLLLLFGLAGCDNTLFGVPIDDTTDTDVEDAALPADVQAVLDGNGCTGCHATTLPLLPDELFADIEDGGGAVVVPNSKEDSAVWRVISGNQEGNEQPMPLGATGPLPQDEVDVIGSWIDDGAAVEVP